MAGDGARRQIQRRQFPRRYGVVLAAVPVLAVGLADATIAIRTAGSPGPAHSTVAKPAPSATSPTQPNARFTLNDAETKRNAALSDLLDRRRRAILHRDLKAFLATDDPAQPAFRGQQRDAFEALAAVPLASWKYAIDFFGLPSTQRTRRYRAPAFAPARFAVHYAIKGFDDKPTSLVQTPTFVHRKSGWYVASFDDYATSGNPSAKGIWDFGPVRTVQVGTVLVIGHPQSLSLMRDVADITATSIPDVTAVWGRGWSRKAVVLVPSTQAELSALVDDSEDLSQIAAVASAEVSSCPASPNPVGGRIAINPRNWPKLSSLGHRVVLTHELTHVATRASSNSCMPTWLIEGFADYVAYQKSSIPVQVIASELGADVRAGRIPTSLPPNATFDGSSKRLAQAYEGGYMACRLIASMVGERGLVRFYTAVGTSHATPVHAMAVALRSILHLTPARFTARWQSYLRSQLS